MTITTPAPTGTGTPPVRVFVSHSHVDKDIVEPLVELLQLALRLGPDAIRATSVDGAQLPVGSEVEATLVSELRRADVTIAVITPASLRSKYVRFELETREGSGLIMPLVGPGVSREELPPQLNRLNWVALDRGIPALLVSLGAALGIPIAPSFADDQRSRLERIVAAAHRRYTRIPIPESFEATFARVGNDQNVLWPRVVLDGAEHLRQLIADGGDIFQPDLILALNQGGMATCAMLKRWLGAPVGVAFTELRESRRVLSLSLPDLSRVRRILLVDTKLKTGGSALNVITELQRSHQYEFCLAVLVAYGPWAPPRWTFPNGVRWPAVFHSSGFELPTYVAYRTTFLGLSDPYPEPWRNDILVPDPEAPGAGPTDQ